MYSARVSGEDKIKKMLDDLSFDARQAMQLKYKQSQLDSGWMTKVAPKWVDGFIRRWGDEEMKLLVGKAQDFVLSLEEKDPNTKAYRALFDQVNALHDSLHARCKQLLDDFGGYDC